MPTMKTWLFGALGAVTVFYLWTWFSATRHRQGSEPTMPTPLHAGIGFVTNFFDTLGIGSFAPTTSMYKLWKQGRDEVIPGTLNVGHTLPTRTSWETDHANMSTHPIVCSDVGLLSSRSEGSPNSVMEYMYARLPVIGTDIPGIREVLGVPNADWLFPLGNAQRLAQLIGKLGSDPATRRILGETNARRIVSDFSAEKLMPEWERILGLD